MDQWESSLQPLAPNQLSYLLVIYLIAMLILHVILFPFKLTKTVLVQKAHSLYPGRRRLFF